MSNNFENGPQTMKISGNYLFFVTYSHYNILHFQYIIAGFNPGSFFKIPSTPLIIIKYYSNIE